MCRQDLSLAKEMEQVHSLQKSILCGAVPNDQAAKTWLGPLCLHRNSSVRPMCLRDSLLQQDDWSIKQQHLRLDHEQPVHRWNGHLAVLADRYDGRR